MKWQTRSGQPYREASINPDAIPGQERLGWYQTNEGEWHAAMHSLNGTHAYNPSLDLVPAPEKVERWIAAWRDWDGNSFTTVYPTERNARWRVDQLRSMDPACKWIGDPIRVEWVLPTKEPTP